MYKIFGHYVPGTLMRLYLSEVLILFASISLAILFVFSFTFHDSTGQGQSPSIYIVIVFFILSMHLAMISAGLYQRDLPNKVATQFLRILLSFIFGMLLFLLGITVLSLVNIWLPQTFFDLKVQALAFGCAFVAILTNRLLLCRDTVSTSGKHQVLVVGTGVKASQLESRLSLAKKPKKFLCHTDTDITGYVDIPGSNGSSLISKDRLIRVNGTPLCGYAKENGISEIIIAMDDRRNKIPIDDLIECRMHGIHITDMTQFLERETGSIVLESFQPGSFIYSEGFMQAFRLRTKRFLDICASLFILILSSPIMLVTALAIRYEPGAGGTVIYRQERVGCNGRPFNLLKFRSMIENAEKHGAAIWAEQNDVRVTRIGRLIRKIRIDELPQLINVLKGDMSLVGPRPERPQFVADLAKEIPFYNLRHNAEPGLTGWAQICYPYGASVEDARQKLQYDLYYIKNYSLFLDINILLQTMAVVLMGKGAR